MEMLDWFEWNGERCTEWGMHVLQQPNRTVAQERISTVSIPGRSGFLTLLEGDDVREGLSYACTCVIDSPDMIVGGTKTSRINLISSKLRGQGKVRFANMPEGYFNARIVNQISFAKIVRGNPHLSFQVQFQCEPYMYLNSGETKITISGTDLDDRDKTTLVNPGNTESEPLIKIVGSGSINVMIGGGTLLVDLGALTYLNLDCHAKIAYTGSLNNPQDPLTLRGSAVTRVTEDWIVIPEGESRIQAVGVADEVAGTTGEIESIEITPRWRVQ